MAEEQTWRSVEGRLMEEEEVHITNEWGRGGRREGWGEWGGKCKFGRK